MRLGSEQTKNKKSKKAKPTKNKNRFLTSHHVNVGNVEKFDTTLLVQFFALKSFPHCLICDSIHLGSVNWKIRPQIFPFSSKPCVKNHDCISAGKRSSDRFHQLFIVR
jgi:hypothetical protein